MYKVIRTRIVRREDGQRRVYEPGDTFEPTESELTHFGDNLKLIEEPDPKGQDGEDDDSPEICGTVMSNGDECERLAEECGYH